MYKHGDVNRPARFISFIIWCGWFMIGVLFCSCAWAEEILISDFAKSGNNTQAMERFKVSGGNFELSEGWLLVRSGKENPTVLLKQTHIGNGTFRAKLRNAISSHWAGLLAKGIYRLEVNNQFQNLRLLRKVEKRWKILAEAPKPYIYAKNQQEFEIRLSFMGKKIYGYVDDKLLIEYVDNLPLGKEGQYGLVSGWKTDVAWKDIYLSDKADLNHWPTERIPVKEPKELVEVTWVRGLRDDNIYFDGEKAGLRIRLKTKRSEPSTVYLKFKLVDVREKQVGKKYITRALIPDKEIEIMVEFVPRKRGCFKVVLEAGAKADKLAWVEDVGSFTVLSKSLFEGGKEDGSYFGGHFDAINVEWHLDVGRKLGIQWARCHDGMQTAWWPRIQPDRSDQWLWPYDTAQKILDQKGFATLGEFLWTPKWASRYREGDAKAEAQPPKNLDDLMHFVGKCVEHYGESIQHWEVWNEPHYAGYWQGTPEDYAKLLEVIYRTVKNISPSSFVLGGGGVFPNRLDWIERMLQAGGGQYMDGFSIHYLWPDAAADLMPRLRALLERYGFSGPIWNTETSVLSTSFLDQLRHEHMESEARYHFRNACFELVRMYMENIANGIQRVFYYQQMDPWRYCQYPKPRVSGREAISGGMWDEGRMLKPIAAAHAAMVLSLKGKRYLCRIARGPLSVFIFEGTNEVTAVQYAEYSNYNTQSKLQLQLPPYSINHTVLRLFDFMGNESEPELSNQILDLPISREPIYLTYTGPGGAVALRYMYASASISSHSQCSPVKNLHIMDR